MDIEKLFVLLKGFVSMSVIDAQMGTPHLMRSTALVDFVNKVTPFLMEHEGLEATEKIGTDVVSKWIENYDEQYPPPALPKGIFGAVVFGGPDGEMPTSIVDILKQMIAADEDKEEENLSAFEEFIEDMDMDKNE